MRQQSKQEAIQGRRKMDQDQLVLLKLADYLVQMSLITPDEKCRIQNLLTGVGMGQ